jgi:DNA invertase Pin-like site-specific DNA recombinase
MSASKSTSLVPAAGYLRRSSDSHTQVASLPEQREAIQRYADEHGYKIVRWYTDDAISGDDTRNRQGFLQMVSDARERRDFTAIICWDRARFGRFDSIEYGHYVFPLREAGIHLATVIDGVTDWSDASGRIVANVLQEGKHQQLIDHSANVTRGQLGAANNGSWIGSPPYAYRVEGPKKSKRLILDDPGKVAVVRRIFKEYTREGLSLNAIAVRLNAEGYLSPGGRVNGWRFDTVKVILENPAYTGDYVACRYSYGKYHTIKRGNVAKANGRCRRPQEEWIVRRDHHDAIIDRPTFEEAQTILARGKTGRSPHTRETNPYILSGLLRCGRCGCMLYGLDCRGPSRFYECGNRKYNGPENCEGTTVRENKVLEGIAEHLEQWLGFDGEALGAAAYYGETLTAEDLPEAFKAVRKLVLPPTLPVADRKRLQRQLEQLEANLARARANLVLLDAENIPAAQERIRQLDQERALVEKELRDSKPPAEKEVNEVVLEVVTSLHALAYCCRVLARPVDPEWEVKGSLESAAPANVRRFLNRVDRIVCHTTKRGQGHGTRHVFQRGEIIIRGVGQVTSNLNPHLTG